MDKAVGDTAYSSSAVYGWYVTPIGWKYALAVRGYALVWFLINNAVKVHVYRKMRHRGRRQARHIGRVHTWLHPGGGADRP